MPIKCFSNHRKMFSSLCCNRTQALKLSWKSSFIIHHKRRLCEHDKTTVKLSSLDIFHFTFTFHPSHHHNHRSVSSLTANQPDIIIIIAAVVLRFCGLFFHMNNFEWDEIWNLIWKSTNIFLVFYSAANRWHFQPHHSNNNERWFSDVKFIRSTHLSNIEFNVRLSDAWNLELDSRCLSLVRPSAAWIFPDFHSIFDFHVSSQYIDFSQARNSSVSRRFSLHFSPPTLKNARAELMFRRLNDAAWIRNFFLVHFIDSSSHWFFSAGCGGLLIFSSRCFFISTNWKMMR